MSQGSEAKFGHRTVDEWVKGAWTGQLAVADFQRSFVWPPKKAARYIEAILRGRPVGMYLILDSAPSPQFSPRRFSYMDTPLNNVSELVLDGQQRLSSLLHALYEHPISRFFIEVDEFSAASLSVKTVLAYGKKSAYARKLGEPVAAYRANVIPIDVLRRPGPGADSDLPLTQWCSEVMGGQDDDRSVAGGPGDVVKLSCDQLRDRAFVAIVEYVAVRAVAKSVDEKAVPRAQEIEMFVDMRRQHSVASGEALPLPRHSSIERVAEIGSGNGYAVPVAIGARRPFRLGTHTIAQQCGHPPLVQADSVVEHPQDTERI